MVQHQKQIFELREFHGSCEQCPPRCPQEKNAHVAVRAKNWSARRFLRRRPRRRARYACQAAQAAASRRWRLGRPPPLSLSPPRAHLASCDLAKGHPRAAMGLEGPHVGALRLHHGCKPRAGGFKVSHPGRVQGFALEPAVPLRRRWKVLESHPSLWRIP